MNCSAKTLDFQAPPFIFKPGGATHKALVLLTNLNIPCLSPVGVKASAELLCGGSL